MSLLLPLPSNTVASDSSKNNHNSGASIVKIIAVVLVILFFSFWGIWLFAVPESFLDAYLQRSLSVRGIALELSGLKKGFFYTLHIDSLSLIRRTSHDVEQVTSDQGENRQGLSTFFVVKNLDIKPDVISFLKLSPRFNCSGQVGRGFLQCEILREHKSLTAKIRGEHIDIGSIPAMALAGINGEGNLTFDFLWKESQGEIVFSIDKAKLKGNLAGNAVLTMNLFQSIKGLFTFGNTIKVNPLTMEGQGLYVRVKGDITEGCLDGQAQVLVDSSFPHYFLLKPLLNNYQVSPGSYIIPFSRARLMSRENP